ncbi:hypothetical protein LOZ57_003857 [Ophidiomyces ophidiicola]|uniref:uncharacterized protein n=1 Tax=Ophidiomyces ophidiicola TaxID=1387563 RepID=UPI0020C40186|nr:uncharacterized protein LOZ57_003857 [Ophidiomyces ophidiicola]KAI1946106.1 hypothetical protein LOZ57_003857 [Ophidiomyces ophidiicola]KAI2043486.1 hypothetical protein LOZ43_006607 [Ophidiomyces ophidiicola]
MSPYHIPGIEVIANDRAARRRTGPAFNPFPHQVSFKPTDANATRPSLRSRAAALSARSCSTTSSVVARHESFSSAGSSFIRAALRPTESKKGRTVSTTSSIARNESFSSAGSSFVRSALRRTEPERCRTASVTSSIARNESFSSAGSSFVRSALRRTEPERCRTASVTSSIARNESFSSAGSSYVRAIVGQPSTAVTSSSSSPSSSRSLSSSVSSCSSISSRRSALVASSRSAPLRPVHSVPSNPSSAPSCTIKSCISPASKGRARAEATIARLNDKYSGHTPESDGPHSSALKLKSAMKKPGPSNTEKRVQFTGGRVKIVDRWIVRGVDTHPDHSASLLGKLSGWRVTPLSKPDKDGETEKYTEYWCSSCTQLKSHSVPCEQKCAYCQVGKIQKDLNRRNGISDDSPFDISSQYVFKAWNQQREKSRARGNWVL